MTGKSVVKKQPSGAIFREFLRTCLTSSNGKEDTELGPYLYGMFGQAAGICKSTAALTCQTLI